MYWKNVEAESILKCMASFLGGKKTEAVGWPSPHRQPRMTAINKSRIN
jgi:hypothetical protein